MTRTPLLDRIEARRSGQDRNSAAQEPRRASMQPAPTRAPRWLERLQAKDTTGNVLS